jgi:hypothetical protein
MSTEQLAADAGGAIPPVTVGSMVFAGVPLQDWVLILTAIYTLIMIAKNAQAAWVVVSTGVQALWRKVRQQKKP